MALMEKKGYGQVEIQDIIASVTGELASQVKVSKELSTAISGIVEQGMFFNINSKGEYVTGDGSKDEPTYFIYNERRLYNPYDLEKDFAMKATDHIDGVLYPRGYFPHVGDCFTTNLIDLGEKSAYTDLEVGDTLIVKNNILTVGEATGAKLVYRVDKVYTMPDEQPGVMVTCIKAK